MRDFRGTQGSWQINEKRSHHLETEIVSGKTRIAQAKHFNTGDNDGFKDDPVLEEGKANAYLIASAPDLFKALNKLLELHSQEQEGIGSGCPSYNDWMKACAQGEKAILKATNYEQ